MMNRTQKFVIAGALVVGFLSAAVALGAFTRPADAIELPPTTQQMDVFADDPVDPSHLPTAVIAAEARLPDRANLGAAIPNQVRLLGQDLGRSRSALYAFPTTRGGICFVVTEAAPIETCLPRFRESGAYLTWSVYSGPNTPQTITGVAANRVTRVEVLVDGEPHETRLDRNMFFWQAADPAVTRESIDGLITTLRGGRTIVQSLDFRQ